MKVNLTKIPTCCTRCGVPCAYSGSVDIDSICTACAFDMNAEFLYLELPTPHDFAFALREPAAAMPGIWGEDLPEAQGLWRF